MFNSQWHDSSTVAGTIVQQSPWHHCSTATGMIVQQSLAQLINSHWHDSSLVSGTIVQQSLAPLFNSHWYDFSLAAGMIVQPSLAHLFNSHWHDYSTVAGTIVQQSLVQLFNSHWHYYSTVAGMIVQQSRARFFLFSMLAEFFNIDVHCWRIVPCTRNTAHDPSPTIKRPEVRHEACNFTKKKTLAQAFSCEFCEISNNIFSHRTPPAAASANPSSKTGNYRNKLSNMLFEISNYL